jgi:uncharacterized repeat protein (TIGR01451 family)
MIRLIRCTLIWVPALVLLLLVQKGEPLTAQNPSPMQASAPRGHLPSRGDAPLLAEVPVTATATISDAGKGFSPSALLPTMPDVEDVLLALQAIGCGGTESLAYEASCGCVQPCDSCIHLEKAGPTSAQPGERITFKFTVTNCGDKPLLDVWVIDPQALGCDRRKVGHLRAGESYSFEEQYVVPTKRCGDLVNVAWATARSPHCSGVCDKASWTVAVPCAPPPTPAVEVAKGPQVQTVEYGASATFAITVTNVGKVDLASVIVDDPRALECSRALGALAVGSSASYQCSVPDVTLPFTNVVVVTATTPAGQVVSDQDRARVLVAAPAIGIAKSPHLLPVERGGIVTFTISLNNPGEVALGPVTVRDPLAPDCDRAFDALPQGASMQYQCASPPVTASFTNTVSATAMTPGGSSVTAQDQARVVIGGLHIEKFLGIGGVPEWQEADSPPGPAVYIGTPVWFWFMVRNSGDAELSGLLLTDSAVDLSPYPECVPPVTLQPGEPFDCVVGPLVAEVGQHSDTGQITGEFAGTTFSAADSVYYLGYDGSGASIDIEKYIAISGGPWQDADSIDAAPEVPAGPGDHPLIQFRFAVMNTGAVPLDDVSIVDTDLDLSSCAQVPSPLVPGASYECIVELPKASPCLQTNVATATGYYGGLPYSDTDAVHYVGVPCFTPTFYRTYLPYIAH